MKIAGKNLSKLNELVIVFERNGVDTETGEEAENIVLTLRPIKDYQSFLDLVPEPKAPLKILKGGVREKDVRNPAYLKKLSEYHSFEVNYTLIHSLQATKGLEFDRVKLDDPTTWKLAIEELQEFLYDQEVFKLYEMCTNINNVTDASLDKARERFLAGERRRKRETLSSLISEQSSTQSGDPVKDSESSQVGATSNGTTNDGDSKPEISS